MEDLLLYPFPAFGVQMEIEFVRGLAQHRVASGLTVGSIPQGDPFPWPDHARVDVQIGICLWCGSIFEDCHSSSPF